MKLRFTLPLNHVSALVIKRINLDKLDISEVPFGATRLDWDAADNVGVEK